MSTTSHNRARISDTVHIFNGQVIAIDTRLQLVDAAWGGVARYIYLGADPTPVGIIQTMVVDWTTNIYPKYLNPATKPLVDGRDGLVQTTMKEFKELANPVLETIAASPLANHDDEIAFNIVLYKNHKDPSHITEPISQKPTLTVDQGGVGDLMCIAREGTDGIGRANIPHEIGADSVEVAYYIVPANGNSETPVNPDTLETRQTFRRAHFLLHLGGQYRGRFVQLFVRWNNTAHPEYAGGWTQPQTIVIP